MAAIMKTREQIVTLLEGQRRFLQGRYGVRRIALFGSYARAEQREDSDVDILVDFSQTPDFFEFLLHTRLV